MSFAKNNPLDRPQYTVSTSIVDDYDSQIEGLFSEFCQQRPSSSSSLNVVEIEKSVVNDLAPIQMDHLRNQPLTPAESDQLRTRVAQLERESLEKDRTITRLHSENARLEVANLAKASRIRSLQENSLLNRNASEILKNSLNGLKEGIALLHEKVEIKQVELPFGQNNEEEIAVQRFVNYVLREIENLNSLVRTNDIDADH